MNELVAGGKIQAGIWNDKRIKIQCTYSKIITLKYDRCELLDKDSDYNTK